ncbi:DUF736 domain-containing protein [Komagataeibacter europaeus]|uniref:DUF736 domain-containing protein n=1 Tax=Komagataeibacter europaeus TaxID=33995 RepID=UPI0002E8F0F7|nr:DUF736 domain-containing protein [Komagataeibacter europaeus]GBQ40411.1 hypothetical protein AA18890_0785 [Komagataeibacter europaeus LMG 18890]
MAQIGTFTRTADGFAGRLRTLALDVELTIVPATSSDAEHAPDYRVHLGDADAGPEIGAGWKRTGEKAGTYLALVLDDPMLAQPIRANLFQSDRQGRAFHLVWNRPVKRDDLR